MIFQTVSPKGGGRSASLERKVCFIYAKAAVRTAARSLYRQSQPQPDRQSGASASYSRAKRRFGRARFSAVRLHPRLDDLLFLSGQPGADSGACPQAADGRTHGISRLGRRVSRNCPLSMGGSSPSDSRNGRTGAFRASARHHPRKARIAA
ncbi:hypothetical protein D3C73_1090340 [compost metagenome]